VQRYAVEVSGPEDVLPRGVERRVVFHGVNKSGSLAAARVLREAYHHDRRAHEFFSQYMGVPRHYKDAVAIIRDAGRGHALFIGHRLYRALEPDDGRLTITQFRHPLPRIVSIYHWLKHRGERGFGDAPGYGPAETFPTLEEFVERGRGVAHSQINQIGIGFGSDAAKLRKGAKAADVYERAVEALERDIHWFGIAEELEESLFTYAAICGLPSLAPWARDDRNTGRQMVWDLPDSTRSLIEEVYAAELGFYRTARDLFRQRLERLEFGADLAAYKTACESEYKDRLL
jgi:hypothetical protein